MPRRLAILLLLVVGTARAMPAQRSWSIGLAASHALVTGDATDRDDPADPSIRPFHPSGWTLSVAREAGPWRVDLAVRAIDADLAVGDRDVIVLARRGLSATAMSVDLSRRIAGDARGTALRVGASVAAERWTVGGTGRTRLVLEAIGALDAPLSARWAAEVRLAGGFGPSLFRAEDLPEGYRRSMERRITVALGVRRLFR